MGRINAGWLYNLVKLIIAELNINIKFIFGFKHCFYLIYSYLNGLLSKEFGCKKYVGFFSRREVSNFLKIKVISELR